MRSKAAAHIIHVCMSKPVIDFQTSDINTIQHFDFYPVERSIGSRRFCLVRLRIKLLFALFAADAQRPVYGSFLEFGIFDAINIFVSQFSIYATMEADE